MASYTGIYVPSKRCKVSEFVKDCEVGVNRPRGCLCQWFPCSFEDNVGSGNREGCPNHQHLVEMEFNREVDWYKVHPDKCHDLIAVEIMPLPTHAASWRHASSEVRNYIYCVLLKLLKKK